MSPTVDEPRDGGADEGDDGAFEHLLGQLRVERGLDLAGYKRSSLRRRILRRMAALGHDADFARYGELLRERPDEVLALLDTILINVTSFFRDPEAWRFVADRVIPAIVAGKDPAAPIRVWSAACASGQEAFTVAILLAEHLGLEQFSRQAKIYATDRDDGALQLARRARFPLEALEAVPEPFRERYFRHEQGAVTLSNVLRRAVIFGQHDLIEDAPISRVDLLTCRNALMYFNLDAQHRILDRLHFALDPRGYLVLGRAEMLLSHAGAFTPVDLHNRVFTRLPTDRARRAPASPIAPAAPRRRDDDAARAVRLREAALDASPLAQLVLDPAGRLAVANQRALALFRLAPQDLGRPLQDLEMSYRPVDLRSMIDEALAERRTVVKGDVEMRAAGGELRYLEVSVSPAVRDGAPAGMTITVADVTEHRRLRDNLQRFSENLETAYEELQSANEELETTNEELQSANEELETTNEELQAASEEMETINEELRSTNDELQQTNERMAAREQTLLDQAGFLERVLGAMRAGVVVVDRGLVIRSWNASACELWGLRAEETLGRPLAGLDIGLPVEEILAGAAAMLAAAVDAPAPVDSAELALRAINRRGRPVELAVVLTRLGAGDESAICVVMEERGTARA